ncbi:DUF3192 domain-containing protein [Halomonas denitrificans]|nr:DUF3192 domain-containing protein [Halomonas denitrificans]
MMKSASRLLVLLTAATILSGCVVAIGNDSDRRDDWARLERENREAISMLEIGMTRAEVESRMPHPPAMSEAFPIDGEAYTVLFYRTQRVEGDGRTTRDETTPVIFVDGILDAWGEAAYVRLTGSPLSPVR